jgi:hypothetical protein
MRDSARERPSIMMCLGCRRHHRPSALHQTRCPACGHPRLIGYTGRAGFTVAGTPQARRPGHTRTTPDG